MFTVAMRMFTVATRMFTVAMRMVTPFFCLTAAETAQILTPFYFSLFFASKLLHSAG
jgi:hypothetical protein